MILTDRQLEILRVIDSQSRSIEAEQLITCATDREIDELIRMHALGVALTDYGRQMIEELPMTPPAEGEC